MEAETIRDREARELEFLLDGNFCEVGGCLSIVMLHCASSS